MSDEHDDPLVGFLTSIAEGVALAIERIDALEAKITARDAVVDEALETIAEITARIYHKTEPQEALPSKVINADVMNAMIERWPAGERLMGAGDRDLLRNIGKVDNKRLDALITRTTASVPQNNCDRIRRDFSLKILKQEFTERAKSQA